MRPDHLEHVESHGLGERAALPGEDLVAGLNAEAGGDVDGRVLVTLLETIVLLDVVKVVLRGERGGRRGRRVSVSVALLLPAREPRLLCVRACVLRRVGAPCG